MNMLLGMTWHFWIKREMSLAFGLPLNHAYSFDHNPTSGQWGNHLCYLREVKPTRRMALNLAVRDQKEQIFFSSKCALVCETDKKCFAINWIGKRSRRRSRTLLVYNAFGTKRKESRKPRERRTFLFESEVLCQVPTLVVASKEEEVGRMENLQGPEVQHALQEQKRNEKEG